MSLDPQTLAPLFELSRDAVFAVGADRTVRFANPAARTLLDVRPGDRADDLLLGAILDDPGERFVTAATVRGQEARISAVRSGELMVFTLFFPASDAPAASPVRDRALQELGSDLLTGRLAIDAIIRRTGAEADEKLRSYTEALYRSYYRVKRLQEHMALVFSLQQRTVPFSPRIVRLDEMCAELCRTTDSLVRSMDLRIEFEAPEDDYRAKADQRLMEILLLNLLSNSLLHAAEGDTVRVTLRRQDRRFVLAVDDPGRGIAPERLAALMDGRPEAELTDTAAGAGLGLVIVRSAAELHGGSLILESREDAGTRTLVWLPCPGPEDLHDLCQPDTVYRTDGMNAVLTELSVVLDKSWYNRTVFD